MFFSITTSIEKKRKDKPRIKQYLVYTSFD